MRENKEPMVRVNIRISKESQFKAKMLSASLGITVSHLIEGLIMGVQLVPGKTEVTKNAE